jgi:Holliday junction resolvasome RuvABC endonuclease subunit
MSLWSAENSQALEKEVTQTLKQKERKREKNKKKRANSDEKMDSLLEQAKSSKYILGFDMSMNSPALTIVDRSNPDLIAITVVCFSQTKAQLKAVSTFNEGKETDANHKQTLLWDNKGQKCSFSLIMHEYPSTFQNNTERFEIVTEKLIESLRTIVNDFSSALAIIENYAFNSKQSSSVTGLAEIGGVIRNKLFKREIPFFEIPPSVVKNWFTGSGAADKPKMWSVFQKTVVFENTGTATDLQKIIPGSFNKTIPSPHQDIVDSFASAFSVHGKSPYENNKRRKEN